VLGVKICGVTFVLGLLAAMPGHCAPTDAVAQGCASIVSSLSEQAPSVILAALDGPNPEEDRRLAAAQELIDLGDRLDNQGHSEQAILSYTAAIKLGLVAEGRLERGIAYNTARQYDKALEDLNEAVRLLPGYYRAFQARGDVCFDLKHYDIAARDLKISSDLAQNNDYPALWLYMARTKLGEDARQELSDYSKYQRADAWPVPIVALFIGSIGPDDAMKVATGWQPSCEAPYYVAQYYLAKGDNKTAAAYFHRIADRSECRGLREFRSAIIELETLTP
jgi:lipoprotein NlpI